MSLFERIEQAGSFIATVATSGGVAVKTTNAIAVASIAAPVWLPSLEMISQTAALWTPILGAVWLVTQIVRAWMGRGK